jgi:peroxiredoxin
LTAVSKLNMQEEFPLFKQIRDDLRKVMPRSGFYAMFRDQVDRLEQQEIQMRLQEEEMKRLSNLLPIGSEAPDFQQATPEGGSFGLSQLRGKYVLIDFWASWCRPCRIENPNVKRIYERFHNKGFEILGVSLDRDHASWVKAIQDDGLPWKHVSDLGFWNNAVAQEYGVSSIPYTVLVDREGKILEKGLRSEQLEAKLAEVLGR